MNRPNCSSHTVCSTSCSTNWSPFSHRAPRFSRPAAFTRSLRFGSKLTLGIMLTTLCLLPGGSFAQRRPEAPAPTVHTPREREYHVRHLKLLFTVNAGDHSAIGIVTHYLTPLHGPLAQFQFDARANLKIDSVMINGKDAQFEHKGDVLTIFSQAMPLPNGKEVAIEIRYAMPNTPTRGGANGAGGFRWTDPNPDQPDRKPGFWTQGETNTNSSWVPCYDFPNDKCTSETHVTVPADWTVIGNGLESPATQDTVNHTRTYHWTMKQPHSTYLLSLVGGELDVQKDIWRGVPLYYVVPKGRAGTIPGTFGNTPDMLSLFSDTLGVKYAWPKYAQCCVFDFPGGMENVSATTLGMFLADMRSGHFPESSINSHELAHQWFGDLVTCKDWGDIWLNESFATFFEMYYMEHLDGEEAYESEVESNTFQYLFSSQRRQRALATNVYSDPDAMFESGHTYSKGGVILHMLRRQLGDKAFFKGLGSYLKKYAYQPVDTADLESALSDYTRQDLKPFFDQWVRKPGHPVLDMTWTYDEARKEVVATVKQQQNTTKDTPVYNTPLTFGLLPLPAGSAADPKSAGKNGMVTRRHVTLNSTTQEFRLPTPIRPAVVLLDPDHDLLKEIKDLHWTDADLPVILRYAPNSTDRRHAANLIAGKEMDATKITLLVEALKTEPGDRNAANLLTLLGNAKSETLRAVFRAEAASKNDRRRSAALGALGKLSATDEDIKLLRAAALSDTEPYSVVTTAMGALGKQNVAANLDVFQHQSTQTSVQDQLAAASVGVLNDAKLEAGVPVLLTVATNQTHTPYTRAQAIRAVDTLAPGSAAVHEALVTLLNDSSPRVQQAATKTLAARMDKEALPALKTLASTSKVKSVQDAANEAAGELEGK